MASDKGVGPPLSDNNESENGTVKVTKVTSNKTKTVTDKHPNAVGGKVVPHRGQKGLKSQNVTTKGYIPSAAGSERQTAIMDVGERPNDQHLGVRHNTDNAVTLLTETMSQMTNNMALFMNEIKKSHAESLSEIRRSQQEMFNSFCDNEGSFRSDNSDMEIGIDYLPEDRMDGAAALHNLLDETVQVDDQNGLKKCDGDEINNLTQESECEIDEFSGILSQYNREEKCGPKLSEKLTKIIDTMVAQGLSDETMNELMNKYKRPENSETLGLTKVNPPIWDSLPSETRSADIKLQKIQHLIVKGLTPLAYLAQKFMDTPGGATAADIKDGFRMLTDSMALLAAANAEINGRRRVNMKKDVNTAYRSLCTLKGENGKLLFGDDLTQRVRDIHESNRVTQRLNVRGRGHRNERYSPYQGARFQRFSAQPRHRGFRNQGPKNRPFFRPGPSEFQKEKDISKKQVNDEFNTKVVEENISGLLLASDCRRTCMADTGMVSCTFEEINSTSHYHNAGQRHFVSTIPTRNGTQTVAKTHAHDMPLVRAGLAMQGISEEAQDIICKSWRNNTTKQYTTYLHKWQQFCGRRGYNPMSTSVNIVLNFLVELYKEGLGYSAINTARSALSNAVKLMNDSGKYNMLGQHPLVCRFLKGVFECRPALPKYTHIWNVDKVINYLGTMSPVADLSLRDLTLKLVMLMTLLSGQRCQSIHSIKIGNIIFEDKKVTIPITDVVKQSRPQRKQPVLVFPAYTKDENLCVVSTLQAYVEKTAQYRVSGDSVSQDKLFLTTVKPYMSASQATVARWIRTILSRAGIDTSVFQPHSVRSASTSAAARKHTPIRVIMQSAGWKSSSVFRQFYHLPIVSDTAEFADAIMNNI